MNLDPRLTISFGASIAFDIIMPLAVGFIIARHYHVSWRYFGFGALVFLLSQLITRVPAVQVIQFLIGGELQSSPTILTIWIIILAVTAGLFEETGRLLGYRYLVRDPKTWEIGLMYGAGHEGLESIVLIGGLALLGFINIIAISAMPANQPGLTPEQLQQIELARQQIQALAWYTPLLGAYERLTAMALQISLSILVLQVFLRGSYLWYWLAVGYHALVDGVAVLVARAFGAEVTELLLTVVALFSLWLIFWLKPKPSVPVQAVPAVVQT